jgi:hypothetical protein
MSHPAAVSSKTKKTVKSIRNLNFTTGTQMLAFRGNTLPAAFNISNQKKKATASSETSGKIYQTTRRHTPENLTLHYPPPSEPHLLAMNR